MINKLLIATGNKNKLKEIKNIFNKNGFLVNINTPKDFNCDVEPIEDGLTFHENAYIKAKFYYDLYHIPCIGEDSGICIEYLNNLPGVHSKRFMGHLTDDNKNDFIIELMKNITNRNATFYAVICYIDQNGNEHYFEGISKGEIALIKDGDEGFGYDPIFLIPKYNKTEARLGNDFKNENGHRAKAFNNFIEYLKNEE